MTGINRDTGLLGGLYQELARVPPDLSAVGQAIARALIGPLASVSSVSLYDEGYDRLDVIGAAAEDPADLDDYRSYIDAVCTGERIRFKTDIRRGQPVQFVATDPGPLSAAPETSFIRRGSVHHLIVPLGSGDLILGSLQVGRARPHTADEVAILAEAGRVSGPAVDSARLVRRLRRTERITRAMAGNIRLVQLFAAVLPELREILRVDTVRLLVLADDGHTLRGGFTVGAELDGGGEVPVGVGFAGRIAAERRPLVVEDVTASPLPTESLRDLGVASVAGVPVMDDGLLGVLHVGSYRPRRFGSGDMELLQLVADRLATALSEDRIERALRRTEALARSVLDTAADAIVTFDAGGLVRSANRSVERLFGYAPADLVGSPVALLMAEDHDLTPASEPREVMARRRDGTLFPVDLTISRVDDAAAGPLFTAILRDARERVAAEERLRHQALHDTLTGLPNRALFGEHLDLALARFDREGRQVAVMFLDLDRFKIVNDSLGHAAGDDLLRQVVERLRQAVRPSDVLARLGGDEFAILLEGVMPRDPIQVARRMLRLIEEPFVIADRSVHVGASIGIAHTRSRADAPSAADLLRHADAALYRAKESGRGRYDVFDDAMRMWLHRRLETETELHQALAAGQIGVHYQPLLDLRTGRVRTFEALARWVHPRRGTVPADEFIGVAEETGLIGPLGIQVTRQATRQLDRWQRELGDDAPGIAINLSASQLSGSVAPILEAANGQITRLGVEITETALMSDVERVARNLHELKEHGATIIVDDFGTGYSSLAYLQRLPIDMVKIDRAFVERLHDNPDDRAIVHAIIQLAHALGITVVAEGVETREQLDVLEELDCDRAQGFLIAPPRAAPETLLCAR